MQNEIDTWNDLTLAITREQYDRAYVLATNKLEHIIEREGDSDGERHKTEYFKTILTEIIQYMMLNIEAKEKASPASKTPIHKPITRVYHEMELKARRIL